MHWTVHFWLRVSNRGPSTDGRTKNRDGIAEQGHRRRRRGFEGAWPKFLCYLHRSILSDCQMAQGTLFTEDFLNEGIRGTEAWQSLPPRDRRAISPAANSHLRGRR